MFRTAPSAAESTATIPLDHGVAAVAADDGRVYVLDLDDRIHVGLLLVVVGSQRYLVALAVFAAHLDLPACGKGWSLSLVAAHHLLAVPVVDEANRMQGIVTVDDIVDARTRYQRLDGATEDVKIRLKSPALQVSRLSNGAGQSVQVDYARNGKVERVTARHCVLACNNSMIPYLCPALPEKQKTALHYAAKVPFLYTHVALKNWHAFAKQGIRQIVSPGAYHSYTALAFPVNAAGYGCSRSPDSPNVLFMLRAPCSPGLRRRDQHRAGRAELVTTSFATIERNVRDQLQRMLGHAGFDHERDIAGITVNRWAHGYAYEYDSLSDPKWAPGTAPHVIGRQPFGPITIANSDSAASAYTDAAIDMGHRAVRELS